MLRFKFPFCAKKESGSKMMLYNASGTHKKAMELNVYLEFKMEKFGERGL